VLLIGLDGLLDDLQQNARLRGILLNLPARLCLGTLARDTASSTIWKTRVTDTPFSTAITLELIARVPYIQSRPRNSPDTIVFESILIATSALSPAAVDGVIEEEQRRRKAVSF